MQLANIMLAIGGDAGNTVPKAAVTAAEIPILQAIHGSEAVTEVEPVGEVDRTHRDELARLKQIYSRYQDGRDVSPVAQLYPGVAARVFERLDELDLPEIFFKAEKRVSAQSAPKVIRRIDDLDQGPPGVPAAPVPPAPPVQEMTIGAALLQLDPADDSHWTAQGLPAMAAVEGILGRNVSRADVSAANQGFTRETFGKALLAAEAQVKDAAGEEIADGIEDMNDGQLFD